VRRQAVIVDTNVVVAGLLTGSVESTVARILDGMLAAAFPFVVSEALLSEHHAVLVRPSLLTRHGLSVAEVETLITDIVSVISQFDGPMIKLGDGCLEHLDARSSTKDGCLEHLDARSSTKDSLAEGNRASPLRKGINRAVRPVLIC
jgi:predicted nucleic acid-binding protein